MITSSVLSSTHAQTPPPPPPHAATLDTMLRSLVIGQICVYGDADSIAEAKRRFDAHVAGTTPIPSDLQAVVFSASLANGDEGTFDQLIKVGEWRRREGGERISWSREERGV